MIDTLRHIKPGVAHWATDVFCRRPEFLHLMPNTTPRQRIWLLVVDWATNKVNADFGAWAARHVPEISGRTHREVGNFLADIADWARTSLPPSPKDDLEWMAPHGRATNSSPAVSCLRCH